MELLLVQDGNVCSVREENGPTEGLQAPSLTAAAEIAETWAKVHRVVPRLRIVHSDGTVQVLDPDDPDPAQDETS